MAALAGVCGLHGIPEHCNSGALHAAPAADISRTAAQLQFSSSGAGTVGALTHPAAHQYEMLHKVPRGPGSLCDSAQYTSMGTSATTDRAVRAPM